MRVATIFLAARYGKRQSFAVALGAELRARRLGRGLTQRQLAAPLTGAYVSAVERGRSLPSLPALAMMLDRLGEPIGAYFDDVERRLGRDV